MKKLYLGDGVYIDCDPYDPGSFILTTENGVEATNTIVLEYSVATALMEYIQRARDTVRK